MILCSVGYHKLIRKDDEQIIVLQQVKSRLIFFAFLWIADEEDRGAVCQEADQDDHIRTIAAASNGPRIRIMI